jgi:acetylglutamate kinase
LSVGLSGVDAGLAEAEPFSAELGAVGRVVRTNPALLNVLVESGYLPVVACVAGDRSGQIYNVNADQMAVACAAGFAAERLIYLTDVDGVRGAGGETIRSMTESGCTELIDRGIATGGMQAKLTAACDAVRKGIQAVSIAPGAIPNIVVEILNGGAFGTVIRPGSAS